MNLIKLIGDTRYRKPPEQITRAESFTASVTNANRFFGENFDLAGRPKNWKALERSIRYSKSVRPIYDYLAYKVTSVFKKSNRT